MPGTAIEIKNISKQYRLGIVGATSMADDLKRFWAKIKGLEDPTLKIGQTNVLADQKSAVDSQQSAAKSESSYVWALKDITFEVKQGDVLGIIGKNGAGKSTLLKILSKVTSPTTGTVKVNGRIASLLEVGTGFHPELTGKENIFLNGAILGMTKSEIHSKFDEIVDFSGVEKYINTPVKRYSSGMYVRLAFAVAAHLDPEILIIDEVLAVGDIEFQNKCLGKMSEVARGGRTVLFVSHNLAAVQKLCKTGILLDRGLIAEQGLIQQVLNSYIDTSGDIQSIYEIQPPENKTESVAYIYRIEIKNADGKIVKEVPVGEQWKITICFHVNQKCSHFIMGMSLKSLSDFAINTSWSEAMELEKGEYQFTFINNEILLASGKYYFNIGMSNYERNLQHIENAGILTIAETGEIVVRENKIIRTAGTGVILNTREYNIEKIE
jgi:lipopolysaccharide transport system ATP-binding protein